MKYFTLSPPFPSSLLYSIVPRADVLQLIQLVFTVLTLGMQDNPANKLFFETNVSNIHWYASPHRSVYNTCTHTWYNVCTCTCMHTYMVQCMYSHVHCKCACSDCYNSDSIRYINRYLMFCRQNEFHNVFSPYLYLFSMFLDKVRQFFSSLETSGLLCQKCKRVSIGFRPSRVPDWHQHGLRVPSPLSPSCTALQGLLHILRLWDIPLPTRHGPGYPLESIQAPPTSLLLNQPQFTHRCAIDHAHAPPCHSNRRTAQEVLLGIPDPPWSRPVYDGSVASCWLWQRR